MTIEKLKEKKAELLSRMETLVADAEDNLSEDAQEEFDGYKAEYDATVKSIETAEALEKVKADADKDANRPAPAVKRVVEDAPVEDKGIEAKTPKIIVPASSKNVKLQVFKDAETAYSFGQYVKACIGDYSANVWCAEHGITPKFATAHNATTDSQGGYLIPVEYSDDILNLLNTYGVARRECKIIPMASDTFNRPKRLTGLTAAFVTESAAATESNKTWGQIQLTVKDAVILSRMTKQLNADALVSVADDLAKEIAYQFGAFEDDVLFNADGTATYKTISGVYKELEDNTQYTDPVADGSSLSDITLVHLREVVSKLPSYARQGAKWYVSPVVWDSVMNRLADAAGGNTNFNIVNGVNTPAFLGYPVVLSDACNTDGDADGAIVVVFGNMAQAVDFGDRQQVQIDFSDSATIGGESVFERSQIAVRGRERFDINVHSYEALYGLLLDTTA